MKLNEAELSTLQNACYVAIDRFKDNIALLQDVDHAGYERSFENLIGQFEKQIKETGAVLDKLEQDE